MQGAPRTATCAVICYGYALDLNGSTAVADAAARWRFANPCAGRSVADLRRDVPLFIARAGQDQFPGVNDPLDLFLSKAVVANLPVTFVNHPDGPHAFDLLHDSPTSRDITRQALGFMQRHLLASDGLDVHLGR